MIPEAPTMKLEPSSMLDDSTSFPSHTCVDVVGAAVPDVNVYVVAVGCTFLTVIVPTQSNQSPSLSVIRSVIVNVDALDFGFT